MSRSRRAGKLAKLDHKDRLAKAVRNEKRKRVSAAVKWEKEHVVKEPAFKHVSRPSRRRIMEDKLIEELSKLPGIEEVKRA